MNKYVNHVMDDLGVPAHLKGYEALRLAMEYKFDNYTLKVTTLYNEVAKKMSTTDKAVERNIRHLVQYMLINGDYDKIHNYFGSSLPIDGKLTNKQFIWTLVLVAKRMEFLEDNNANNRK